MKIFTLNQSQAVSRSLFAAKYFIFFSNSAPPSYIKDKNALSLLFIKFNGVSNSTISPLLNTMILSY